MRYDYKCVECGHAFEGEAKMADPCPPCPGEPGACATAPAGSLICGGKTVKVFKAAAPVHFKGGGWFKDGYSKGGR